MSLFERIFNIDDLKKKQHIRGLTRALADKELGFSAKKALSDIGKSAVPHLIAVLGKDKDARARWLAADVLGEIGDRQAAEALIAALNDKDYIVRSHAVVALGALEDPRAIKPLINAFTREKDPLHAAAASLIRFGAEATINPLIAALGHNDDSVRFHSAEALGELRDPRAFEPLIAALNDEISSVRYNAAKALGKLGDPRAIEPLRNVLKDRDSWTNKAVADALRELKDPDVDTLLAQLEPKPESVYATVTPDREEPLHDSNSNDSQGDYKVDIAIPEIGNIELDTSDVTALHEQDLVKADQVVGTVFEWLTANVGRKARFTISTSDDGYKSSPKVISLPIYTFENGRLQWRIEGTHSISFPARTCHKVISGDRSLAYSRGFDYARDQDGEIVALALTLNESHVWVWETFLLEIE